MPREFDRDRSRLIFHVGMAKSGTTSIQETLYYGLRDPRFRYVGFGQVNGSRAMRVLFSDSAASSRLHLALGFDDRDLAALRRVLGTRLEIALSRCRRSNATPIVSAEWCWRMTAEEMHVVRDFFQERGFLIDVIAYVRPLWSWYASAFQERVKWGSGRFEPFRAFDDSPTFRDEADIIATIAALDSVFGAEHVRICPFEPSALQDGCIVQDFCRRLGIAIDPRHIRRANDGLCRDAVGFLYTSNVAGAGYGRGRHVVERNMLLQRRLARLGGPPFRFHRSLLEIRREEIERQHAAVAERIGAPFGRLGLSRGDDLGIRDEAGLFVYDAESVGWLERAAGRVIPGRPIGAPPPREVAALIDHLRLRPLLRDRWYRTGELISRELRRLSHGV